MANISFLLHEFPIGGIERVIMNLATPLAHKYNHRIFMFVHILNNHWLPADSLPITYIQLPYGAWDERNEEFIEENVKKYNIDVFFSPQVASEFIYNLKRKSLCKLAYVFHGQPFYEVKEMYWNACNKPVKTSNPIKIAIKWLIKHLITIPKFHFGYYDKKVVRRYKDIYENTDAFGTLFDEYSQNIASAIGVKNLEDSKFCTLQNPVKSIDSLRSDLPREKRILYVGRLSRRDKRIDRLLMVWKRIHKDFPEWRVSIIGEGEDKESLMDIIAKHKLPRVEFLGYKTNTHDFYSTSEILSLCSDFEGFGLVLVEAQANGCACMAFDCSAGVREILSPIWENGAYAPNGDIKAYAETLSRLMSDDELRAKIQRNGLENVKRFSVEESARQYNALIQKLILK